MNLEKFEKYVPPAEIPCHVCNKMIDYDSAKCCPICTEPTCVECFSKGTCGLLLDFKSCSK
jgi:hypothetical protein